MAAPVAMWDTARPAAPWSLPSWSASPLPVTTGLIAHGEEGKGPLAVVMVTDANADSNEAGHRALTEKRGGETESTIGELHGLMANITLALVAAHIFGV